MSEGAELTEAVRRAVRFIVADKISACIVSIAPSVLVRILVTLSGLLLIVGARGVGYVHKNFSPSSGVFGDIAIFVSVSNILELLVVSGPNGQLLTFTHYALALFVVCAGDPILSEFFGGSFASRLVYLSANSLAGIVASTGSSVVALVGCGLFASVGEWGVGGDKLLSSTFILAAVGVFRIVVMASLPFGMQVPSIVGVLCLIHPLHSAGLLGMDDNVYSFILYQSAEAIQVFLRESLPERVAAMAAITLVLVSPVRILRVVSQMAAVGAVASWVVGGVREVADTDPFPSLLSLLVFARVLTFGAGS